MTSVPLPAHWPRFVCPCGETVAVPPMGRDPLPHYDMRSVRAWIEDAKAREPRLCREPRRAWKAPDAA